VEAALTRIDEALAFAGETGEPLMPAEALLRRLQNRLVELAPNPSTSLIRPEQM
jgi:hypothetical protein